MMSDIYTITQAGAVTPQLQVKLQDLDQDLLQEIRVATACDTPRNTFGHFVSFLSTSHTPNLPGASPLRILRLSLVSENENGDFRLGSFYIGTHDHYEFPCVTSI